VNRPGPLGWGFPWAARIDYGMASTEEKTVLVLQGGGALGAYQAGAYEALCEGGYAPRWVAGISIGAVNAAIIAGNPPDRRVRRLREFWERVSSRLVAWPLGKDDNSRRLFNDTSAALAAIAGVPGFFEPRIPPAVFMPQGTPEALSVYDTAPLYATLNELIDFDLLNSGAVQLSIGAVQVLTGNMKYFDTTRQPLGPEHVMASGALPPGFPPIEIDGEFYWDGGILSNTPTEVIFDDNPRRNSLIFAVHLWNPEGPVPQSIWEVLHRQKDIQYSSRIASHITRQQQTHRLRHVISQLVRHIPDEVRQSEAVRELAGYGCVTQMHVVRLLAPRLENENHTKDIDFSPSGIGMRREAGYEATMRALKQTPWQGEFDPIDGVILHESMPDLAVAAE